MADNKQIAADVLKAVGGKDNITHATHCMTRLRLNFKDESIVSEEAVKAIDGVTGVIKAGGQFQIIIGQNVPKVYSAFCEMAGIGGGTAETAAAAAPKMKLTRSSGFPSMKIGSRIVIPKDKLLGWIDMQCAAGK